MSSIEASAATDPKPTTFWVIQIIGTGTVNLLDEAFDVLKDTEGIKIVYDPGYVLALIAEMDDDVEIPIDPKDEEWGCSEDGKKSIHSEKMSKAWFIGDTEV